MHRILYFTAQWCLPCKKFGPALAREADARGIELVRIDVDQDTEAVALAYNVLALPTVLLLVNDTMADRFGVLSVSALKQRLDRSLP